MDLIQLEFGRLIIPNGFHEHQVADLQEPVSLDLQDVGVEHLTARSIADPLADSEMSFDDLLASINIASLRSRSIWSPVPNDSEVPTICLEPQ